MQPELNKAPRSAEQGQFDTGPRYDAPPEYGPQPHHEQQNNRRFEQQERPRPAERKRAPLPPPPPPIPPQQVAMPQVPTQPPVAHGNPIAASDDDVIEKAWVDRAKQVIKQTVDDPRSRELAIAALQRDYLAKRYNKHIKKVG